MRTVLLLAALCTPWLPSLAAAQARDVAEEERIEEDRLLSGRLLVASGHDPRVVAFRTELRLLDQGLRGHQRPRGPNSAGTSLTVVGGVGAGVGALLLLVAGLSSGGHAALCGGFALLGAGNCGAGPNNTGLLVAGGIVIGAGLVAVMSGLIVAESGRAERARFARRDEMRRHLRTWVSASFAPTRDGGTIAVAGSF